MKDILLSVKQLGYLAEFADIPTFLGISYTFSSKLLPTLESENLTIITIVILRSELQSVKPRILRIHILSQMGSIEAKTNCIRSLCATILEVRTGRVKPEFKTAEPSGIFKSPRSEPVQVGNLGLDGDERSYEQHIGPDNALMHYSSQHYGVWRKEFPESAHLFTVGGFGENIVTPFDSDFTEDTVCIGDIFQIGNGVLVQTTKPRMPCYKLSYRFEVKDMNLKSQKLKRTGWYYRIVKAGYIRQGDAMILIERKYPQWTIANVLEVLYNDQKNEEAMAELASMPETGVEIKLLFQGRLAKLKSKRERLQDAKRWKNYRLVGKRNETPRISSFIFEAVSPVEGPATVQPGSHIRVKLGADEKLVRAYSVVSGNGNRFELGVSFDQEASRGGSKFLHEDVKVGDKLLFSEIKSEIPVAMNAKQHVLIAGGIGITAFIATAQYLQEQTLPYHLYYAIRSHEEKALSRYLDLLQPNITILNKENGQRLDVPRILNEADESTHVYVCGPERLMKEVTDTAQELKLPEANVHFEAFTAATSGEPFQVEVFEISGKVLEVKAEETLLEVLRDAGFDVPSSCEVGNCGSCKVGVRKGRIEHRGTGLREDEKETSMLSCVSRGIGKISLLELS